MPATPTRAKTPIPDAPDYAREAALLRAGASPVAGVDEAGRGALAGPVVAAAAVLPPRPKGDWVALIRDSKRMTPRQREDARARMRAANVALAVGAASSEEIDARGIVPATRLAMARAVAALPVAPQHLLIDAMNLPQVPLPQTAIIKGDAKCLSIAAASIAAKTARDDIMRRADAQFPGYGFAQHKGYGAPQHLDSLARVGPCAIHRRSFAPVRRLTDPTDVAAATPLLTTPRMRTGRLGEIAARRHLTSIGYRVIAVNARAGRGEIDIVAEQGGDIVFAEVRARRSRAMGSPEESITPAKRDRMIAAAQEYLRQNNLQRRDWRIDVVAVELDARSRPRRINVLRSAIEI